MSGPSARRLALLAATLAVALAATACATTAMVQVPGAAATTRSPAPESGSARPPLPLRPDGYGVAQPTPPDLVDRRLPTRDLLPPPADGRFASSVSPVPAAVLERSTWRPECPVPATDLRYVTVSFRGFDGAAHTGELLLNARVTDDLVGVFKDLFDAGFPIEQMRITSPAELDAAPTGDDNTTTAFVCRPIVGSTSWSAHAYGLAIDVDPFQNPYQREDLVLPELASAYLDRGNVRPGMILEGGPVVEAFDRIGWTWGGRWRSPLDLQHFSATGH